MKVYSRDAEANKTTSMKVQYDGNLGVRRNNSRPVDQEEGAGCGLRGTSLEKATAVSAATVSSTTGT